MFNYKKLILLVLLPFVLCSREIETFYGIIEVDEPVLLELIDSPPLQRLKLIHQYGVSYYTTHREEYNRFDHSIGVFTILRMKGASLEEQIAGLLHDVSHTAFSHVGDWIFGKENKEKDYQTQIHSHYLRQSGLEKILNKYQITSDEILPKEELFPRLENALPNLCADRIDYNIQGAYHQGFLTKEEALTLFKDLQFKDKCWVSSKIELVKKITKFSLFMTLNCWGSAENYVTSRWLADAILRGIEIKLLTYDDIHFGTDQEIWDLLLYSDDPTIYQKMGMIFNASLYFSLVDPLNAHLIVKSKFRGINPWIIVEGTSHRLTELDSEIKKEYLQIKQLMENGWAIRLQSN